MNPWFAKVAILVATVAMVAIRAPHGRLSRTIRVVESRKGSLEIFLLAVASIAFLVPNWVAGPVYAVPMVLLCAFRLGPEEALMREHFKSAYDAYASRTKRLIPGVW